MPAQPRQVILIMTDSQRADMLGCVDSRWSTPHLDHLASQGLRFTQAHCYSPVCTPARAALFTGQPSANTGAWANQMALATDTPHLGQRLQNAGITAAYTGKWHLDGGDYFGNGHPPAGWEPHWWHEMRNWLDTLTPDQRARSREPRTALTHTLDRTACYAAGVTDRSCDFLHTHPHQDFLLVVSYDEPHHPWHCPRPFIDAVHPALSTEIPAQPCSLDKPAHITEWAAKNHSAPIPAEKLRQMAACNAFVDDEIGRLLATASQAAPDALILYTSDHGEFLGEHGLESKGPALYQPICNIPLLLAGPGIPPATTTHQLATHLDLLPTILSWFDLPVPPHLLGRDLLTHARDPRQPLHETIPLGFNRFNLTTPGKGGFIPMRAIRDHRYKLILTLTDPHSDELYDLATDPGETRNLLHDPAHATIRDHLHTRLLADLETSLDPLRGALWATRPWSQHPPVYWSKTERTYRPADLLRPADLDYITGIAPNP